ncbi:MAG: hypothetical protein KGI25_10065 [Thaumarchaeota archaeon]|nr:hypothetical protein [Nitrososphaerota archaeon]
METVNQNFCKTCGHTKEDHKGTAMICMKQVGKDLTELCDCCWFDDGKIHVLPDTLEIFVSKRVESTKDETSADDSKI